MPKFNTKTCIIPEFWCGTGEMPKDSSTKMYRRAGTKTECLKKGFGAGKYSEKRTGLKETSLQQIKYVGEEYEKRFRAKGIRTTTKLISEMYGKTSKGIETFLKKIFTRNSTKVVDVRAYNSTLLFLYSHGNGSLPQCIKIPK